jgi:hypothetical protein
VVSPEDGTAGGGEWYTYVNMHLYAVAVYVHIPTVYNINKVLNAGMRTVRAR